MNEKDKFISVVEKNIDIVSVNFFLFLIICYWVSESCFGVFLWEKIVYDF